MPVEIGELETHVNVAPGAPGRNGGGARGAVAAGQGQNAAIEALRPLVRLILREELEAAMRERGVR